MIKIPKRRLYNLTSRVALLTLLYFLLPLYLTLFVIHSPFLFLLFFVVNILIVFYQIKINLKRRYLLECKIQGLEEKQNLLNDQNISELKNQVALKAKILRYNSLKEIVEKVNEKLDLDAVADALTKIVFSCVSNNKGVCILYLIDKELNLQIFKTRKEDENLIIKAKEGDIFDFWVLRHISPILIEDIKKDFRFDLSKPGAQKFIRPLSSLISSPLTSEHRFLGTLRLDNPQPDFFSQDDLRFLVAICDLGAVALENSELFQKNQDLAIHDSLTSLYTKGYFLERLREECLRGSRESSQFSLLMLDIDFFKSYNDKFGHTAGDVVLKRLSHIIGESLKGQNAVAGRFGGEEFCIILTGRDRKKAFNLACALRKKIEQEKIVLRRQETHITVSVGIAAFPVDATHEQELINLADKAMYQAKSRGRNKVCCN